MRRALRPLLALGSAAALVTVILLLRPATTIVVPAGGDPQAMLDSAPEGATVRLGEGTHQGPLTIDKKLNIQGDPGATVVAGIEADAAIHVTARDVSIVDLDVEGGWTGIELDDAAGAYVSRVNIHGSDLQGMLIYKASATVDGVSVSGLLDPHAQGIEVLSAPDVIVRNSVIEGGRTGIVGHLSDTLFENNTVTGTTLAGVVIREMGMGTARGNVVRGALGAGLYCGDMSRCAFEDNRVESVASGGTTRSEAGWGLVVHYRSTASTTDDLLTGDAGAAVVLSDSRIVESSPLELGGGLGEVWPALAATLIALAVVAILYLLVRGVVPRSTVRKVYAGAATVGTALLLVGIAVQTFHMLEHIVQLYRVRMDGLPSRGALVGSLVDTEWVHLVYNALVVVGLGMLLLLRRRGWNPPGRNLVRGDRLILAATLFQSYHVVEHALKVTQHVVTGAKVNPGILGNHFDLVLLHFGLNAAIYAAFIAGAIVYLRPQRSLRPSISARASQPTPT